MVAALGSLAAYIGSAIKTIGPYAVPIITEAVRELYVLSPYMEATYRPIIQSIRKDLESAKTTKDKLHVLYSHRDILPYILAHGFEISSNVYRNVKELFALRKKTKPPVYKPATAQAVSIMIATLAISSYFALFAPSKTIHVIKPVSLDTVGIIGIIVVIFGIIISITMVRIKCRQAQ